MSGKSKHFNACTYTRAYDDIHRKNNLRFRCSPQLRNTEKSRFDEVKVWLRLHVKCHDENVHRIQ